MSQPNLRGAWARPAAGLLASLLLTLPAPTRAATADDDPVPVPVPVLQAQRDGRIELTARGQGPDRVKLELRNNTPQRLKVILPPGLVAVAATGQGGGGFQSMGLGTPTNRAGSFGQFLGLDKADGGFRSVPVTGPDAQPGIIVPASGNIDFVLPSVCLNYGAPTPTPRDFFRIVDVDDYTPEPRARKALRSLATLGTSQIVAQAVAWSVFNGLTLEQLLANPVAPMNHHEVSLAGRFLDVLDRTQSGELVDPSYLNEGRLFVRIQGEGATEKDARRLTQELDGQHLLGLTAQAATQSGNPQASLGAVLVHLQLTSTQPGLTRAKLALRVRASDGAWRQTGQYLVQFSSYSGDLQGDEFARELDRAIARSYATVRVATRGPSTTTFKIDNRLPMSISTVVLNAGPEGQAAPVEVDGLGIGPMRSAQFNLPTARATIERIELNGL